MNSNSTKYILGVQHVLAMFGATVLVPALTGLDPGIALISAGIGTLLFHLVTKGMIPAFLGSSFAFIGAINFVLNKYGTSDMKGGIICAGLVYIFLSVCVKLFGTDKINKLFPPVVVGPVIVVIGLRLSPIAINMAMFNNGVLDKNYVIISFAVLVTMIVVTILDKSFFKLVPILIAIVVGYILSSMLGVLDVTLIKEAQWITFNNSNSMSFLTTLPTFNASAIIAIAPIAFVVFIEHIGDIKTNGEVVGKNFLVNPGLHRTLLGDGLATLAAGFIGGPPNTTYGENTGVLAVTKVYDPKILRIAAVYAIFLGCIGKFGAAISSIPTPVMGGISIVLFGMISAIGIRTLISAKLDYSHSRNLIITSLILVTGIGISEIPVSDTIVISGLTIAAFIGVILNVLLPKDI